MPEIEQAVSGNGGKMDKQGTNWTMDGLPIEGGFDVAANDDDEVTNNCDYCGKELDGPWDDFCEEHQDRADEDEDSGKEGSVRRASKVAGGEEDYDEGWDQAWADAQHGNLPDPEDFTGTHSVDWEAGYQDYLLFGDRDESLPWDPDEDEDDWVPVEASHDDAVTAGYWGSDDHLWGDGPADVVDEVISRKFGEADWDAPLGQMAYPGDFEDYWNDSEVQGALEKAALEFSDDIGRPPSEQELRDGLAFSLGLGDGAPRTGSHKTEDPRSRMSSDDLREAMVEVYDRWELANAKESPERDMLARTYLVLDDELTRRGMVLADDDSDDNQEEGLPWLEDIELETKE